MQIINWSCRSQLLTGQVRILIEQNDFHNLQDLIFDTNNNL